MLARRGRRNSLPSPTFLVCTSPGNYAVVVPSAWSQTCSSGTVAKSGKSVACLTCDASKRQVLARKCTTSVDAVCTLCGASSFVNGSGCVACRPCPPGINIASAYSATANTVCGKCKAGTQLQTQDAVSACVRCAAGKVSVDGQPCHACSGRQVPTAHQHACADVTNRCGGNKYY